MHTGIVRTIHVAALACGLLLLLPTVAAAQKSNNIWYFGRHAGIDFNVDPPASLGDGATYTDEGCTSIADRRTGRLLFYSDGVTVWNRTHRAMPNGSRLHGHSSSTQSGLIVPMPGDTNKFYLFIAGVGPYIGRTTYGIEYAIVDMRLDGGNGDVTVRDVKMLQPATEKLTAVWDTDRRGYWVLAHGWQDDSFHAWHVTTAGIAAPVVSHAGSVHGGDPNNTIGYMKCSIDGSRLAIAVYKSSRVELFRFDNATGIVSDAIPLPFDKWAYGLCFSPDASKLYATFTPDNSQALIYQYDIAVHDSAAIAASVYEVARDTTSQPSGMIWYALMLGPDGRIYCATGANVLNTGNMSAIAQPNERGPACSLQRAAVHLNSASMFGLPNVLDIVSLYHSDAVTCGGGGVVLAPSPAMLAGLRADTPLVYQWQPATGLSCTDCAAPIASPTATTKYELTVTGPSGNAMTQWTTVHVGQAHAAHAEIQGTMDGAPGDSLELRVVLAGGALDVDSLRGFTLRLFYDTNSMRPQRGAYMNMLAGTLAEGWSATVLRDYQGVLEVHVAATDPAKYLHGVGTLAHLRMWTYMPMLSGEGESWSGRSTLRAEVIPDAAPCAEVVPDSAAVQLSLCGLGSRLIELITGENALDANHPNPFNPTTEIGYSVMLDGRARLDVLDMLGREVACLVDGDIKAGRYSVTWDASSQPSGLYYYRLRSNGWNAVRTMTVCK